MGFLMVSPDYLLKISIPQIFYIKAHILLKVKMIISDYFHVELICSFKVEVCKRLCIENVMNILTEEFHIFIFSAVLVGARRL